MRATRIMTQAVAAVALTVVCMSIAATNAHASNFGTWGNEDGGKDFGGYVGFSVPTPASKEHQAAKEISLYRIVDQSGYGESAGLFQVGLYQSGPETKLDLCAKSVGELINYTETKNTGTGEYRCSLADHPRPGAGYCVDSIYQSGYYFWWWADFGCGDTNRDEYIDMNWQTGNDAIGEEINGPNPLHSISWLGSNYSNSTYPWLIFTLPGENQAKYPWSPYCYTPTKEFYQGYPEPAGVSVINHPYSPETC